MIVWGVNALNHGSSLAVFKDSILISNNFNKSDELSTETLQAALDIGSPDRVFWYENPWHKKGRQLKAGQWRRALDMSVLPRQYLKNSNIPNVPITYTPHHASHAAAGYYTSPFNHCAIVVLDAIGEFECASIWEGRGSELKKIWSRAYPNSLGLFYSAFTQLCGFTPILEEYRLQQLAEQGDSEIYYADVKGYFDGIVLLNRNLHKGVQDWPHEINTENTAHIAAAVQRVFEEQVNQVMIVAKRLTNSNKLIYMGGCAMNSKANKLFENDWKHIWSLPQPGDPSSSIGAVLYHTKRKLKWSGTLAKHITIKL
jgi:carbamoyltransferase